MLTKPVHGVTHHAAVLGTLMSTSCSILMSCVMVSPVQAQASGTALRGTPAQVQGLRPGGRTAQINEDAPLQSYWKRSREGWFWYDDPEREPPAAPPPPPPQASGEVNPSTPNDGLDQDLAAFADFKARLDRSLNAATQNPTERNVALFLELWAKARNKASLFTDVAQAVAVRMPWVDETAQGTRPTNPVAQRIFDQGRKQEHDELMKALANNHGLYFFFRSDCPYCHAQVPMLKEIERNYGFTIMAVSLDGGGMPGFPRAVRDNGMAARMAQAMGMSAEQLQVPFTVLANPGTGEVLPVGFGTMTADEMVQRIALVVRMRNESIQQTNASGQFVPRGRNNAPIASVPTSIANLQGVRP